MDQSKAITDSFGESARVLDAFRGDPAAMAGVREFAARAAGCLQAGNKLMSCGNGGSMCDAMHFAEEFVGRFRSDRRALPAMAFSDPSQLTCNANDFGFEEVFARCVEAHGQAGDLLLAISTSGNSANILRAVEVARDRGVQTVGLLGKGGGQLASKVDTAIVVPLAESSDRIQEMHIKVIHIVIEAVERELFAQLYGA